MCATTFRPFKTGCTWEWSFSCEILVRHRKRTLSDGIVMRCNFRRLKYSLMLCFCWFLPAISELTARNGSFREFLGQEGNAIFCGDIKAKGRFWGKFFLQQARGVAWGCTWYHWSMLYQQWPFPMLHTCRQRRGRKHKVKVRAFCYDSSCLDVVRKVRRGQCIT